MAKEYTSPRDPQSAIKKQSFSNFLSTLFGWRRTAQSTKAGSDSAKINGMEFVKVDVGSAERLAQASVEEVLKVGKLSSKLEELFSSWLQDTDAALKEISERRKRVDQLTYAKLNDPFISRVCQLYADEATQLDVQDHIISIESPDPRLTREMYRLLNHWGITQTRCRSAIEQLATYGDAFWSNKITDRGVERIIPLKQLQVSDRLEFNPVDALESLKRKEGFTVLLDRNQALRQMLDDMDTSNDFADLFETKLFGFTINDDLVVPPWTVTHFRVGSDNGEFYPFGTSPILGTLAPFKLASSTTTLQSIARVLSFPVTLYKVKTTNETDEGRQFAVVNRVREEYDNIGVNPVGGNSEVYTINTKIWMPDGLMDVDVKSSQVDIDFVGDIELYQDRVAVATGIPKGYLVQEWGGFGNSAISLTEQWKPFARAVYSLQSAFLEGLSDLFRLHFAINGQFDFRTPFTLGLRFPAEEISDERMNSRTASLDLAGAVLDMVRAAIGAGEDEGLPPDIVRDIISKYTFLDPVDVVKWTRDAERFGVAGKVAGEAGGGGGGGGLGGGEEADGGEEFDLDSALGEMDATGEDELFSAEESLVDPELLRIREQKAKRLRELTARYIESKDVIYFQILQEQAVGDFIRNKQHIHVSTTLPDSSLLMLESLEKVRGNGGIARLKETGSSITDMLREIKESESYNPDPLSNIQTEELEQD